MPLTELTLGGEKAAIDAPEAQEEIRDKDFEDDVLELAGHVYETLVTLDPSHQLKAEAFENMTANKILKAMQRASSEVNNHFIKERGSRVEPLTWRPLIVQHSQNLSRHLRAFLEWVAVVRIALRQTAGTQQLKFDIRGRIALDYQFRFDCLRPDHTVVREDVPVLLLESTDGQLQLRLYRHVLGADGFVLGGQQGCVSVKDLWKNPAVKSLTALERSFKARKKNNIDKALHQIQQQREKDGLFEGVFPELRGSAMNLEKTDQLYAGLRLLEALIASVVVQHKVSRLVLLAKQTEYSSAEIEAALSISEPTEEDVEHILKIKAALGQYLEEFVFHMESLHQARAMRALSTPFSLAEPHLAFNDCPETIKPAHLRQVTNLDVLLYSGRRLRHRKDAKILLRHNYLARGLVGKTWQPKILLDFQHVCEVAGDVVDGMYKLRPQVLDVGRPNVPLHALRQEDPAVKVALSKEDVKWRPQAKAGKQSNSDRAKNTQT